MIEFNVFYISRMIWREVGESDRAWARRRHSARVQHRKSERARFRESQRTGRRFYPQGLNILGRSPIRSLDAKEITAGAVRAESIASGALTVQSLSEGVA